MDIKHDPIPNSQSPIPNPDVALKTITYFLNGKKKKIKVKICNTILSKTIGLMFKKSSPSLLFIFNKNKKLSIHSIFCKPFKAIWLDEKMNATKVIDVKTWKLNISGKGKYLLEIPTPLDNGKFSSIKEVVDNRNI